MSEQIDVFPYIVREKRPSQLILQLAISCRKQSVHFTARRVTPHKRVKFYWQTWVRFYDIVGGEISVSSVNNNCGARGNCEVLYIQQQSGYRLLRAVLQTLLLTLLLTVTDAIGDTVADAVADTVGDAVADAVGDAVADAVADTVGDAIGDAVADAVGDAVADTVADTVGDAIGDAVADAVGDTVGDAVGDAIGDTSDAVF